MCVRVCVCVFCREHNECVRIATSCSQNFNVFVFVTVGCVQDPNLMVKKPFNVH